MSCLPSTVGFATTLRKPLVASLLPAQDLTHALPILFFVNPKALEQAASRLLEEASALARCLSDAERGGHHMCHPAA
ncbi:hypothetical protein WJX72_003066 [[Myrmecia] bisecta]|uniref:Uncharacterized protein n=1 Tax=[Myrmecia] bisecta TaxID=41462 RepID=A0AAW1QPM4_9CHLO